MEINRDNVGDFTDRVERPVVTTDMGVRRQLMWLIPLALLLIAAVWAVARMGDGRRDDITPGASGERDRGTVPYTEPVPQP